jgi:hypothetical protein
MKCKLCDFESDRLIDFRMHHLNEHRNQIKQQSNISQVSMGTQSKRDELEQMVDNDLRIARKMAMVSLYVNSLKSPVIQAPTQGTDGIVEVAKKIIEAYEKGVDTGLDKAMPLEGQEPVSQGKITGNPMIDGLLANPQALNSLMELVKPLLSKLNFVAAKEP